jgi:hypothetical protein
MKDIGRLVILLVVLWLGCMALNFMDSHGMITPPPAASTQDVGAKACAALTAHGGQCTVIAHD